MVILHLPPLLDELKLAEEISHIDPVRPPVHFEGFGWGENITLGYLAWPAVKLFNIDPIASIRAIVLCSNLLALLLLYFVAKKFFDQHVAYITLLFGVLWPWSIISGSIGFNAFLLVPMLLGIFLLLFRFVEYGKTLSLYIAAVLSAISCYTYAASFIWIPTIYLLFIFVYRSKFVGKHTGYSILLIVFLALPIAVFHFQNQFHIGQRHSFLFFSYPELHTTRLSTGSIFTAPSATPLPVRYILNYGEHFNYLFLSYTPFYGFTASGFFFIWDHWFLTLTPHQGLFWNPLAFFWDPLFIVLGLYFLIKDRHKKAYRSFLLLWIIAYPMGASFLPGDLGGFTATRDLFGLPVLLMLSAFGATKLMDSVSYFWGRVRRWSV